MWTSYVLLSCHSDNVTPVFHLATLFARCEAKTRIRHRDWLKLVGEKIRQEQETAPTFLSVRATSPSGKRALGNSVNEQFIHTCLL